MRTPDPVTTAAGAFAVGGLLLVLTGCSQIDDFLGKEHREEFATYEAAAEDWVGVDIPAWIPSDATELRNLATFDETVAVVRVVTASDLAGDCEEASRRGIPALAADWSPDSLEDGRLPWPDEVWRCGDYEVMAMDDGWLGWFNATEPGQTPS